MNEVTRAAILVWFAVIALFLASELHDMNQRLTSLDHRLEIIDVDLQNQTIAIKQQVPACVIWQNEGALGSAGDATFCGDTK